MGGQKQSDLYKDHELIEEIDDDGILARARVYLDLNAVYYGLSARVSLRDDKAGAASLIKFVEDK